MNRIVVLRLDLLAATVSTAFVNKTSGVLQPRHVGGIIFEVIALLPPGEIVMAA
jgi:hypothetical protein